MTRPAPIYVDMDDVLCETARHFLIIIEREFGKQVPYEQLTDFNFEQSCGLSRSERARLYEVVHFDNEILSIDPIPEAIDVLRQWAGAGHEIAIVTGRPPDTLASSLEWLARFKVPYHSFTIVDKYGRFQTDNTIGLSLADLASQQFCWAVEDSLPMAQFLATQMKLLVALLDRPWNRTDAAMPQISRFRDWQEIGDAFSNSV